MNLSGLLWKGGLLAIVAGVLLEIFCRWWTRRQQARRRRQVSGRL